MTQLLLIRHATNDSLKKVVRREVQAQHKKVPITSQETKDAEDTSWQDELVNTLLAMKPAAFERLVQRLLREAGFIQVEVTGCSKAA